MRLSRTPLSIVMRLSVRLRLDVGECLMVSANSFDVMGAKVCGYKSAFVNRYEITV